jgi:hypothetical protein
MNTDPHPQVFLCRQCGDCCSGRGGIYVRPDEVEAMAALVELSVEEFSRLYVEPWAPASPWPPTAAAFFNWRATSAGYTR